MIPKGPLSSSILFRVRPRPHQLSRAVVSAFPRADYSADKSAGSRETVKPRGHENTRSGTDEDVSQHEEVAFDPSKTGPDQAHRAAEKGKGKGKNSTEDQKGDNPLDVSPANVDISKPQGDEGAGEKKAAEQGKGQQKSRSSSSGHGRGQLKQGNDT